MLFWPGVSAGVAQLVEQLICNQQVIGSNPIASSKVSENYFYVKLSCQFLFFYLFWRYAKEEVNAHVAQLVEHFLGKEEVTGSNPVVGSRVSRLFNF